MKTTPGLASEKDLGGAWYFATKLGRVRQGQPRGDHGPRGRPQRRVDLPLPPVPEILAAGSAAVASLDLLAPGRSVSTEFEERVMKKSVLGQIDRLAMFTMSEAFEKRDTCIGVYGKSLLYLIRASLEKEADGGDPRPAGVRTPRRRTSRVCSAHPVRRPGRGDVVEDRRWWSVLEHHLDQPRRLRQRPRDHEQPRPPHPRDVRPAAEFPGARRSAGDRRRASGPPEDRPTPTSRPGRPPPAATAAAEAGARALHRHRPVPGAVPARGLRRGREAWKLAFEQAGFTVDLLTNKKATRERMVETIKDLVVSSRAGDVLALQYSGHGTTVEDFNHDEEPEFEGDTGPGRRGHLSRRLHRREPAHRRRPRRDLGPAARRREPDHLLRLLPLRREPA